METDCKGGQEVPVTLSVACGERDFLQGKLCPMLADKPLAAQVDALTPWHSDKSMKHALVSVVLPEIAPKQRMVITFKKATPAAPAKFETAVVAGHGRQPPGQGLMSTSIEAAQGRTARAMR
jgi:hypothetical protein